MSLSQFVFLKYFQRLVKTLVNGYMAIFTDKVKDFQLMHFT